jgi:hypothetical protein
MTNKKVALRMPKGIENLGCGALKILECGMRISDFEYTICLIFQSAIRNRKSAID